MASTFDPVRMSRLRDDQSGADATNTHLYITAAVLGLLFYAVFKIMQMPDQAETSLAALRKERAEGKSSATRQPGAVPRKRPMLHTPAINDPNL